MTKTFLRGNLTQSLQVDASHKVISPYEVLHESSSRWLQHLHLQWRINMGKAKVQLITFIFHLWVPVSQHARRTTTRKTDTPKWKAAIVTVIKVARVWRVNVSVVRRVVTSLFPLLHPCIIYIQRSCRCFCVLYPVYYIWVGKCSGCSACLLMLSRVCVYMLWKSPAAAFVMQEATRFTSPLSRRPCLRVVACAAFVTVGLVENHSWT